MHFEKFAPLTPSVRGQIENLLSETKTKSDAGDRVVPALVANIPILNVKTTTEIKNKTEEAAKEKEEKEEKEEKKPAKKTVAKATTTKATKKATPKKVTKE